MKESARDKLQTQSRATLRAGIHVEGDARGFRQADRYCVNDCGAVVHARGHFRTSFALARDAAGISPARLRTGSLSPRSAARGGMYFLPAG